MKYLMILAAVAAFCAATLAGDTWVHLATQSTGPTPASLEATFPPLPEQLIRAGWRRYDGTVPPIAAGYERLTGPVYVQDPAKPARCVATFADTPTKDRTDREAAQAAAAEQARIAQTNAQAIAEADLAAWRTLKQTVADLDPALFPVGPQRDAIRAIKQALRETMRILRPD
jgi:hypothetical protein